MKKNLTVEDAEFVIKHWKLTAHHRVAAELILGNFLGLQKECERLLEENERLQPPADSRHIIPVGDHLREISARDRTISELRQENAKLQRKCAAQTLYGTTEPKDRISASANAAANIDKSEAPQ